jgi:Xaa-Pro aminopeptidase
LIDPDLLDPDERAWLNDYHAEVLSKVGPKLDAAEYAWLARACAEIG